VGQKVDDSDETIVCVAGAETVNSSVMQTQPGGFGCRRRQLNTVELLIIGPELLPSRPIQDSQGCDAMDYAHARHD
jgi:hypothetical protein